MNILSADAFLGVPFNIASYALLTHMLAQQLQLHAGYFIHTFGDVHIYNNHREQVAIQLQRYPTKRPHLHLNQAPDLFSYRAADIFFADYHPAPTIAAPVAV